MGKFYLQFIVYILILRFNQQKFIDIPIYLDYYNIPTINVDIGNPPQKLSFHISTLSTGIFIINREGYDFEKSKSFSFATESFKYNKGKENFKAKTALETFYFSNSDLIEKMEFILFYSGKFEYIHKGMIGFEYKNPKIGLKSINVKHPEQFSLFHRLYLNHIISKEIISIWYDKGDITLRLGEYPEKMKSIQNDFYFKTCNLIDTNEIGDDNHLWQCELNAIYTDSGMFYKVDFPVTFSLGGNVLCVDKEFYEQIKEKYFSDSLKFRQCKLVQKDNYEQIECVDSFVRKFKMTISFVIGKWNIKVSGRKLWVNNKIFKIIYSHDKKYNWCLSINSFLINFITVFDKERKKIVFLKTNSLN